MVVGRKHRRSQTAATNSPRADDLVEVHPLLPDGVGDYFCPGGRLQSLVVRKD
jgi:hypothetical protein